MCSAGLHELAHKTNKVWQCIVDALRRLTIPPIDKRSAKSFIRTNERTRAREVRVIDENGEQLGVMVPFEFTTGAAAGLNLLGSNRVSASVAWGIGMYMIRIP